MEILKGVRIRCDKCKLKAHIHVDDDGNNHDPVGWQKRGSGVICTSCVESLDETDLHPEVVAAAERLVHKIQALMATELSSQPAPGAALTFGSNGMSRRMKRCELLTRYADVVMTVYGNVVGFRLASAGAFGHTTLGDVANACEDLMKAEIAFSQARASKRAHKPTSNLSRSNYYADDNAPARVSGPLFRLQEVSKVAQKLAQIAATRAGEVGVTQEDAILDRAVDEVAAFNDNGLFVGRPLNNPANDAVTMQRQLLMVAQRWMEKEEERRERSEASATQPLSSFAIARDPIYELEHLIELCVHDWEVPPAEEMLSLHLLASLPQHELYLRRLEDEAV